MICDVLEIHRVVLYPFVLVVMPNQIRMFFSGAWCRNMLTLMWSVNPYFDLATLVSCISVVKWFESVSHLLF